MQLYYNPDFGYIVCAQTTLRGSAARVIMAPVTVLDPSVSDRELGNAIWKSLERSRTARPIDRSEAGKYHFWEVSGVSSFYSFSKQFLCLTVSQVGLTLRLCPLERDLDGSYACPANYPYVDLPRDSSSGELGAAVRNMFSRRTLPEEDELRTFVTDWGSCVAYRRPSGAFLDAGDGHTDAYQVFRHADYPGNVIAFLNYDRYTDQDKFCQCSEEGVRSVWQASYGPLVDFEFSRNTCVIEALGRTAEKELDAYIFPDGEGSIKIIMEIDLLNTPEEVQRQICEEFEAVMSSFQIEAFEDWASPPSKAAPDSKNMLPKEGKERAFLWVQLVLTCIAAAITYYPIHEAWDYMSFAGIGSLIMFVLLGPGLIGLIVEAVLFFLTLREGNMGYALAAYVIQIICGLPATCLLLIDPGIFYILGVHTVLMALAVTGLIVRLSAAYR